jgi:DNA polymerase III subunit delta
MARKQPPRFYILHGEDEFTLTQMIDKMRAEMHAVDAAGLNLIELDGRDTSAAEALSAVSAMPFLADRRLAIVRGLLTWISRKGAGETGKKQRERLLNDLPNLPDYARLVFWEPKTLPKNSRLLKLAQSDPGGYEKAFSAPKNLTQWLIKRAERDYNAVLHPPAAHALASVVQGDLRRADNELFKLVSYTNGGPIDEATVALLTPYTSETVIWDMIDAMAAGRGEHAMIMLHKLLDLPDENGFRIWALFVRQFRLMLLAKEHLDNGGTSGNLAAALGTSAYAVRKLPEQVRAFSLDQLEGIYRKLREYDEAIKTGRLDIKLALDMLVAGVAR